MAKRKTKTRTSRKQGDGPVRVSVSFAQDDYAELKNIAKHKKVSIAWVVRDAVDSYLSARTPLFGRKGTRGGS